MRLVEPEARARAVFSQISCKTPIKGASVGKVVAVPYDERRGRIEDRSRVVKAIVKITVSDEKSRDATEDRGRASLSLWLDAERAKAEDRDKKRERVKKRNIASRIHIRFL